MVSRPLLVLAPLKAGLLLIIPRAPAHIYEKARTMESGPDTGLAPTKAACTARLS